MIIIITTNNIIIQSAERQGGAAQLWRGAAGLQRADRNAADMPELDENPPALVVDGLGHALPAFDLLLCEDAWDARISCSLFPVSCIRLQDSIPSDLQVC